MPVMHRPCPVWVPFSDGEYSRAETDGRCHNCQLGDAEHPVRILGEPADMVVRPSQRECLQLP